MLRSFSAHQSASPKVSTPLLGSPMENSVGPESISRLFASTSAPHTQSQHVQAILEKLPRSVLIYHPDLEKDLNDVLTILSGADAHLESKRVGRCQIDKDPAEGGKLILTIYDIHERDRAVHVKGTSKTVKTESYRISIISKESEIDITSVQKVITLAKDSPILSAMNKLREISENDALYESMPLDEIRELQIEYLKSYHQLKTEGFLFLTKLAKDNVSTHQIPYQENLGENFLNYINEQKSKLTQEQKKQMVLSILKAVGDLFAKDSFKIFDIKLENMAYIVNEDGEIKVNLVDHIIQGETLAKLPSTFQDVVLADTIDEETGLNSPEIETLKVCILTLVSCVEILDDSGKVHIHQMSKEQIQVAFAKLDVILQGPHNPFPFMTPENYAEASAHIKSAGFGG